MGHYLADKLSSSLPALSCAFDQQNGDYCVLIPTQHQLHHRVGEAIVKLQSFSFKWLLPLFFTYLSFMMMFVILNKAFCGWICPLGTAQEMIYLIGRKLKRPFRTLLQTQTGKVRPIKWLVLVGLVFVLPLMAGLGVTSHATGDAFCQVCPSRILTTLATANPEQVTVTTSGWTDIGFGIIRNFMFGFILIAALVYRQPFCRICPMLALHAVFRRFSLLRLTKKPHESCDKCGICPKTPANPPNVAYAAIFPSANAAVSKAAASPPSPRPNAQEPKYGKQVSVQVVRPTDNPRSQTETHSTSGTIMP